MTYICVRGFQHTPLVASRFVDTSDHMLLIDSCTVSFAAEVDSRADNHLAKLLLAVFLGVFLHALRNGPAYRIESMGKW